MSGRFNRILVPVDFEPASFAAFGCAKDLAASVGAQVFLLHAVDDPAATGVWTPEVYVPATAAARDTLLRTANDRLTEMVRNQGGAGFNPTIEARVGAAIPVIEEYAREQGIDLIVMGTHGRRGLAHMLLGSVAEQLVRTAPCPVLTVRQERPAPTAETLPEVCDAGVVAAQ